MANYCALNDPGFYHVMLIISLNLSVFMEYYKTDNASLVSILFTMFMFLGAVIIVAFINCYRALSVLSVCIPVFSFVVYKTLRQYHSVDPID